MVEAIDHSAELPLNIGELLSRVDNDQELLRELVQLFKEECPLMKSLQDAVSKEQMKTLETTGHTLKSMLASMSATGQPWQHLAFRRSVAAGNIPN